MQKERDDAIERAKELQKQRSELHRDHEALRKSLNLDLQNKVYCTAFFACMTS